MQRVHEREARDALTLVVKRLPRRTQPPDVVAALEAQGLTAPITRAALNPRGDTCFVTFASLEALRTARALCRSHRLVVRGTSCRAVCADAATEQIMGIADDEEEREAPQPYEDPQAELVALLLKGGLVEQPLFPLLTPAAPHDHIGFAHAWKTLVLEECRAQMWAASRRQRNGSLPHYVAVRLADDEVRLAASSEQPHDLDLLLPHDACLVVGPGHSPGALCCVHSVRGSVLRLRLAPQAAVAGERGATVRVYLLASLLTAKRCYDALNWYHTVDLRSSPVLESLFLGKPAVYASTAPPRPPSSLNEPQGRVVSSLSLLEQGAALCQGPPGSGKTTLTVACIAVVARPGTHVVVCAPSNKAVQEVLVRFRTLHPELPVVFCGNKRRPLPPLVDEVYLDTFFSTRLRRFRAAAATNHERDVEAVCVELRRWGVVEGFVNGTRTVETVVRQCLRLRRGECWSCGRALPCQLCSGAWAESSKAMCALEAMLESAGSDAQALVLRNSRVVFATLASAGRRVLQRALPAVDTLIVDEAAQASEPELLVALRFAPTTCLLIGDPQQLPATVFSEAAAAMGYGISTMERLMTQTSYPYTLLDVQYRMMPSIRAWPSQRFYADRICDAPSVTQRTLPWGGAFIDMPASAANPFGGRAGLPAGNRCLVDLSDSGSEHQEGTSWRNDAEAVAVVHLLLRMKRATPSTFDVSASVGVITMYSAQQAALRERLERTPQLKGVRVATVDGFQGGEMDVVVVCFTRTRPSAFLANAKRLNVALTRARFYCVLTAHASSLARHGEPLLQSLMRSFASEQVVRSADIACAVTSPSPRPGTVSPKKPRSRGSPSTREWSCAGCDFYNFGHRAQCLKCGRGKTPSASSDSGDDAASLGSAMRQLRVSELVNGAALRLEQWWTCPQCSQRNAALLCIKCRCPRPDSWEALLASEDAEHNAAAVAQVAHLDRGTVFRSFATHVLFAHCPAARAYDNLDARQLRAEARLWQRHRRLAQWLGGDVDDVMRAARDMELPAGLLHRLRQYIEAYSKAAE